MFHYKITYAYVLSWTQKKAYQLNIICKYIYIILNIKMGKSYVLYYNVQNSTPCILQLYLNQELQNAFVKYKFTFLFIQVHF